MNAPDADCGPGLEASVPEWLIEYPQLWRIVEELRIDYSCGGKSLDVACRERGLDPRDVIARLRDAAE